MSSVSDQRMVEMTLPEIALPMRADLQKLETRPFQVMRPVWESGGRKELAAIEKE